MKRLFVCCMVIAILLCLFAGCDNTNAPTATDSSNAAQESSSSGPAQVDFSKTDGDMFTERDLEVGYDESAAVRIELAGSTATANSDSVKINGSTVTITEEATYIVSGTLDDGMLIVNCNDNAKLQLVLDGANITSATSAALYILEADKVFLTLAEGSENSLINGGSFEAIDDNNIDGALFSKQDLTLNGQGSLTVTSPAGHGIACKDDLVITSGAYTVNAASHGLDANDSVRIANAQLTLNAGKDGIHAENSDDADLGFVYVSSGSLSIEAEGDGISVGAYGQFEGGSFTVMAGGGSENGSKASSGNYGGFPGGWGGGMGGRPGRGGFESTASVTTETDSSATSMKGIKAEGSLLFSDGSFTIDSADDAIHTNVSATINGGTFQIASGDDAIHAEDTLTVTGGTADITESYEGLEALHINISGGNIRLIASDDGLNAAGGTDASGITGGRDGMFGAMGGGMGGPGGMSSNSNGSIVISGGDLYIHSSGDGIDANGTLEISGGYTVVVGPTQGDTATLDYDKSAAITGGTFIGTGASGMAQTFSSATQGVFAVRVGSQSADSQITLTDAAGNVVISHTPELAFQVVILSCPDIVSGESYTITVGTVSETFEAN